MVMSLGELLKERDKITAQPINDVTKRHLSSYQAKSKIEIRVEHSFSRSCNPVQEAI